MRVPWLLALAALVIAVPPSTSRAQAADPEQEAQSDEDRLYDQLLADPANVDLNLRYAMAAQQNGNLEGAVSALERLLALKPEFANVRLKLGQLYAQLGSYAMARAYLDPIAEANDLPPELRAEAKAALQTVNADAARGKFSGTLFLGSQWQSNPGAAPGSPLFLITGTPQQVSQSFAKQPDNDLFAQASGQYTYDLATPYHDAIEADGILYVSSYRRQHQLDTTLAEVTAGPQLGLGRVGLGGGTLRPYALVSGVRLGGAAYDYTGGLGLQYTQKLGGAWPTLGLGYEGQQASYSPSNNYPTAGELDGRLDRYALTFAETFGPQIAVDAGTVVIRQNTRLSGYSNTDYALVGTVSLGYDIGRFAFGYPLVTTVGVSRHYIPYDGADPTVAPGITRTDRRWQFSLGEIVPVTERISVVAVVSRDINTSNVINYAYTNTSFLVGPQLSF
jgi:tetratricopeptide (TPR) repeat protein